MHNQQTRQKVHISYNPYTLETISTVNDQPVQERSRLMRKNQERLQEWIEDLPIILKEECNDTDFNLTFHGTLLDYEDVDSVISTANKNGFNIKLLHQPAQEVSDKEEKIDELFQKIKSGPYPELYSEEVINSFDIARSADVPVNVVATVSSGKSTIINSLLQKRLMPSEQNASTATIIKIRDKKQGEFTGYSFDSEGVCKKISSVDLPTLEKLNKDTNVKTIELEGNIPFMSEDDMNLVLIDTPGTNNARDESHGEMTLDYMGASSKQLVLYILDATKFGVEDDKSLLSNVARSMSVGGKQSKDRFLFVLNKLDEYTPGQDSINGVLENAVEYLETFGIYNPNIFPISALSALEYRTRLAEYDFNQVDTDTVAIEQGVAISTHVTLAKFLYYTNKDYHFEKRAPLTPSDHRTIERQLEIFKEEDNIREIALIHTGVPSLELAIKNYVNKYAATAKIKNLTDTFMGRLEGSKSLDDTKKSIAENVEEHESIKRQIDEITIKVKEGKRAQELKDEIDRSNFSKEMEKDVSDIRKDFEQDIRQQLQKQSGGEEEVTVEEAENIQDKFQKTIIQKEPQIFKEVSDILEKFVTVNANNMYKKYIDYLGSLVEEIDTTKTIIKPELLLKDEISKFFQNYDAVTGNTSSRQYVKERWTETDPDKKWFKPWTWFKPRIEKVEHGTEYYVTIDNLSQSLLTPMQTHFRNMADSAVEEGKSREQEIKAEFKNKFDELDKIVLEKINELAIFTNDAKEIEDKLATLNENLVWIEEIQQEMTEILAI